MSDCEQQADECPCELINSVCGRCGKAASVDSIVSSHRNHAIVRMLCFGCGNPWNIRISKERKKK